jgi:large repetitive protein
MKNLLVLLAILFSATAKSQIQANQDIIAYSNAPNASPTASILDNDSLNGVVATSATVSIAAVNLPNGFIVNTDGTFSAALGTPSGYYNFSYSICEIGNSTNCATATATILLATSIVAIPELITYLNAPNAPPSSSVFDNDLLNGAIPTDTTTSITGINLPSGITINANGTLNVALSTSAGVYYFSYSVCEKGNPTNCATTTSTLLLTKNIIANPDFITYTNSPNASQSTSVLGNDELNGVSANDSTVTVTGINVPVGFTLNANGTFTVALGTPAGAYTFAYSICETANPTNCATTSGTILLSQNIIATQDFITYNNAPNIAPSASVLANDELNGIVPTASTVIVSGINVPVGFTLNSDGSISVAPGTPAGGYNFNYSICEAANPTNCATTFVTVLLAQSISATPDFISYTNAPNALPSASVFDNDLLIGNIPTDSTVIVTPINVPVGFTLNANGTFTVALGTPAGAYTFAYSICETANLTNCATTYGTIVLSTNIQAYNDAITFQGPPTTNSVESVLDNDSLYGLTPDETDVNISTINIPAGFTLNTDGTILVDSTITSGNYTLTYQICEVGFTNNCSVANASIVIDNPFPPTGNKMQTMPPSGKMTDLQVAGQNLKWYTDSIASLSNTPLNDTTTMQMGTTYYASQTINGVESKGRLGIFIMFPSVITENASTNNIEVFPNPATNNITISSEGSVLERFELYNINGAKISARNINAIKTTEDISSLPTGTYLLKVYERNALYTIKINKL